MRYRRSILCLVVLSLCARGTAEDCDGNGIEDELELVDRLAVEARYDGALPRGGYGIERDLAVIDLTGDGWPDVIVTSGDGDSALFLENDGAGGFVAARNLDDVVLRGPVRVEDIDGDGSDDIAFRSEGGVRVVFENDVDALAGPPQVEVDFGSRLSGTFDLGDMNGDGRVDLVVVEHSTAFVFHGDGDHGFVSAGEFRVGRVASGVAEDTGTAAAAVALAAWAVVPALVAAWSVGHRDVA